MIQRVRPFVAPAYLFLCLILGGSVQGVWGNALLQLIAILIIVWVLWDRSAVPLSRPIRQLIMLAGLGLALIVVQLTPLPVSLWASLPGRAQFLEEFRLLGISPAALPLSLAPYDSLAAVLSLLPPMGMFAAMVGLRGYSAAWLSAALIAATVAAVLLGIVQVTSGDPASSPWYLYRQSNFGVATGFFANGNHMASLLLVTIPFVAALGTRVGEGAKDPRLRFAALAMVAGGLVMIVLGLILNGSLAGYGLGVPVILASLLMVFGSNRRLARAALAAIALGSLVAIALLWSRPINQDAATSIASRQTILSNSKGLLGEYGIVGSGLGTFDKVYRLQERPDQVDRYYVNHAHNDYLELAVEMGLPGVVLLLMFLAWWGRWAWDMLRSPAADQYAYAGAIASAALLLHSAVDYPLRTAAMSAVLAMCLALIVQSRRTARSEADLRPARHVVIG